MTEDDFYQLLERYHKEECSPEEQQALEQFYKENQDKPSIVDRWTEEQKSKAYRSIKGALWWQIREEEKSTPYSHLRTGLAVAASIALLFIAGLHFWQEPAAVSEEISYMTKTTTRGQQASITLSDGSKVKLNAESSISFPTVFASNSRKVKLVGEAFFEVVPNADKPFVVTSSNLKTTVLGTSFNINAYPEYDQVTVTVATGKVSVVSDSAEPTVTPTYLIPGEQAAYTPANGEIVQRRVDLDTYLSWASGIIRFDDIPLTQALQRMERWFNVEIISHQADLADCYIQSSYHHESLANILESMEFINGLEYKYETDTKIIITGSKCNY